MSNKDGKQATEDSLLCRTITELKVTSVNAVTLNQLRLLLQQGNWQCGDGEHMECEVLRHSGQTVQCEVLTGSGENVQCEVLRDSGQSLQCEVLTGSGENVECEVVTDSKV